MRTVVPEWVADGYLEGEGSRAILILANALAVLVGLRFYVQGDHLAANSAVVWPVILDSPLAVALMTVSLFALSGAGGTAAYRHSWFHDLVDTLAFVSLLKYGLWTAVAVNLLFDAYFPAPWAYFGILFTHLVMVGEAFLLPYYARTSKPALGVALAWLLVNDVADYWFGFAPRLRADEPAVLPAISVGLSLLAVGLAWYCLDEA
jgi:uncharacterized membrane protein YpjA